jgi:hypothetical protein
LEEFRKAYESKVEELKGKLETGEIIEDEY